MNLVYKLIKGSWADHRGFLNTGNNLIATWLRVCSQREVIFIRFGSSGGKDRKSGTPVPTNPTQSNYTTSPASKSTNLAVCCVGTVKFVTFVTPFPSMAKITPWIFEFCMFRLNALWLVFWCLFFLLIYVYLILSAILNLQSFFLFHNMESISCKVTLCFIDLFSINHQLFA